MLLRIFILCFLFSIQLYAADSYDVATGTNVNINEHNTCKNVANATGQSIFVPTKTNAEWVSFYSATVANVTVTDCDLCPGVSTIGVACPNGTLYLGTFDYGGSIGVKKLLITPGGCTDSATPTCAGTADTVTKRWENSPGTTNVPGAVSTTDGLANTIAILAAGGLAKPAATFCAGMTFGSLSDWHLPAPAEWAHVVTNMTALGGDSLFSCTTWTSRQFDAGGAYFGGDNGGYCPGGNFGKVNTAAVRCILRY